MKKIILTWVFWLAFYSGLFAQNIGYNLNIGVRKTFEVHKKITVDLRQQAQLIPDIKDLEFSQGDFFNEEGFWPSAAQKSEDGGQGSNVPGELDDSPKKINWERRSVTTVQAAALPYKWLRLNTGYSLTHNGFKPRHTVRAELDYRPLKHFKGKRKFDLALRTMFQKVGVEHKKKKDMRWTALLTPRVDMVWTFRKRHTLTWSNALNGEYDDKVLVFDRLRSSLAIGYTYKKKHRFTLGGQYQMRLDKPKPSTGMSLSYEIRL